jgi:hypothetical protein
MHFFFFVVKGPAADATDAPQPKGLFCNPVMKMIRFFHFSQVTEHQWNETDRGKLKYSGGKTCSSATLSTTNPTLIDPESNPDLRGERPATVMHLLSNRSDNKLINIKIEYPFGVLITSVYFISLSTTPDKLYYTRFYLASSFGRSKEPSSGH